MIGETIQHYRVLERIGQGGMGIVFKAEDTRLGRLVALKFLYPHGPEPEGGSTPPPASPPDPAALERFHREARVMSSLNHPNICTVYDVGDYEGQPFIAMEYLEGETLTARLAGQLGFAPFSANEVLDYAIQVAAGLEAAHQHDIVHRDVKPSNIYITTLGQAKLLDFGLARLMHHPPAPAPPVPAALSAPLTLHATGGSDHESLPPDSWSGDVDNPTVTGVALGTLFYMSPEQMRGEELDARSDLYSFGLVLNEMTAAWQSFEGRVAEAVSRPTSDVGSDAELLRGLQAIAERALKKDRKERYQTAAEMRLDLVRLKQESDARHVPVRSARNPRVKRLVAGLVLAAVVALGFVSYHLYVGAASMIGPRGSIVLADFINSTGDPVFNSTLPQALIVTLAQSPLLDILSESNVAETLRLMERPAEAPLTGALAREVCERAGGTAYVTGSIASLGSQYVLQLKATNCRTGDTLAAAQATASSKEKVLDALGTAANGLRRRVGESLASVAKFDVPLTQATTSSFEALEAYSLGRQAYSAKGLAAALPLFHRAAELDPNFAMVYQGLGLAYENAGQHALAVENLRQAYDLRARVSQHERLNIEAHYHRIVTGDLDKARDTYQIWTATYPRDATAHADFAVALSMLGQYERALEENSEARVLEPVDPTLAANAVNFEMALGRLPEARSDYEKAVQQRLESDYLHFLGYSLAFLDHDAARMAQQVAWATGRPGIEDVLLAAEADTDAYSGHLARARDLSGQAADSAARAGEQEVAAGWVAIAALREALFGEAAQARTDSAAALALSHGRDVSAAAGLALAFAGDRAGAGSIADDLARRFPQDTVVNLNYLPAIRAAAAVAGIGSSPSAPAKTLAASRDPAKSFDPAESPDNARTVDKTSTADEAPTAASTAIDQLRAAFPVELGVPTVGSMPLELYPVYVRGLAYLGLGRGPEAATEFQRIIDHAGIVVNEPIGALARLGLARARVLSDDRGAARQAYDDFLDLWKEADAVPVLDQARDEFARLQ